MHCPQTDCLQSTCRELRGTKPGHERANLESNAVQMAEFPRAVHPKQHLCSLGPPGCHPGTVLLADSAPCCGTQRASLCRAALPSACLPVTVAAGMELFPLQCLPWRCVHMRAPHPFAHPRARRHERCSGLAHSHVHAHTCKTFTCKHRAQSHVQCML